MSKSCRFEKCINNLNITLTQNQFDALVSFTFNVGEGGVSCDKQVGKYLREGNYPKACESMLNWCNGGGHFIQGLYNRRLDEVKLFNSDEKINLNVNQNNNLHKGEYFEMSKTFKNGKTSEIIWTNNLHENKVGYLNPFEECKCLAIHELHKIFSLGYIILEVIDLPIIFRIDSNFLKSCVLLKVSIVLPCAGI